MGKRPNRESVIEPSTPRTPTVPTAGVGRNRPRPESAELQTQG
jgi:cell division protease FtsH